MNKGNAGTAILIIFSFITLIAIGFLFLQNQRLTSLVEGGLTAPISPIPYAAQDEASNPVSTVSASPKASPTPTPRGNVAFEDDIPTADRDQITKKIINPYFDFYEEAGGKGYVTALTINTNKTSTKINYPYTAQATFKNGSVNSFLIAKSGTTVDWWVPECLNGCNFSSTFKTKYPEIVAKAQ